ncbi:MAG: sulfatase [Verrucomicrobia bacterium]|nr:sulfatase [Verrucomicrobiota bacterium]
MKAPSIYLSSILFSVFTLLAAPPAKAADKPNFIVIFADDLGYGDLSCFGHPTINTPNLDQMAAEGQKWTNFYVAACVCTPSRAGLLTGRLPIRNGMCSDKRRVLFPNSAGGLPPSEITIAKFLKQKGYQTAAIGKWHLGHLPQFLPTSHGFDSYYGIPYSNDMDRIAKKSNTQTAIDEDYKAYDLPLMRDTKIIENPVDQRTITKRYTEEAVKVIRQAQQKGDSAKPYFIYLAHNLPHVPLFRSEKFKDSSIAGIYGDVIAEIDWSVGQVMEAVQEANEKSPNSQTYVIFTSDNGPWLSYKTHGGSAGLLRDGKGSTWEGGMREPTAMWAWPKQVNSGVVQEMGSTLDLLPTFAGLIGEKVPGDRTYDGYDLSPVLLGTGPSPRKEMFYYHGAQLFAVRSGQYKAHFKTKTSYVKGQKMVEHNPPLLYHLGHDPSEKHDIAKDNADIIEKIKQLAADHKAGIKPVENQLIKKIEG